MVNSQWMSQKKIWDNVEKRRSPTHPVVKEFTISNINYIKRRVEISDKMKILDVGCGNGYFTYYFALLADTIGLDFSENMLSMHPHNKLVIGDAYKLPFNDNEFDIVFCSALLHHLDNIDYALDEFRRVSKNYVILLEPNRNNPLMLLFSLAKKEERTAIKFSMNYLLNKVNSRNLRIIDYCSRGFIFPNKTPLFLLPIFRLLNCKFPLGISNVIISKK